MLVPSSNKQRLQAFVDAMPHAVILHGPEGSAKRYLVKDVLQRRHPESAQLIANNSWQYVQVIQRLEDKKSIGIAQIKSAEELIRLKESHPRYVIVEEAHLLTPEAQNAFLKTMEEPPEGTHIVLLTHQKDDLLATIQSRSQHVQLSQPTQTEFMEYATDEMGLDEGEARKLYYATNANVHEVRSLIKNQEELDAKLGLLDDARQFIAGDLATRVTISQNVLRGSDVLSQFLSILIAMCRAAMQASADKSPEAVLEWVKRIELLLRADRRQKNHVQPRMILAEIMLEL